MATMATRPIPDHVPLEMVGDFSLFTAPGMARTADGDPQAASAVVHDGPRIFYSPVNTRDGKGTWVITRAKDQRRVLQDPKPSPAIARSSRRRSAKAGR